MNFFYKKVSRYYLNLNPSFLFISLSPKTLNPFSITPLFTNFNSHQLHTTPIFCNFSSGSLSDCCLTFPIHNLASNHHFQIWGFIRWFSVSKSDVNSPWKFEKDSEFDGVDSNIFGDSDFVKNTAEGFESAVSCMNVDEIIEVIRSVDSDFSSRLGLRGINLSVRLITEIFRVLNCERVSALHFFQWVQLSHPKLSYNSRVCSLMISNCGWLGNYETMIVMLKEFRSRRVCLDEKAFEFIPVITLGQASMMESIRRVVDTLNEVGGSCCGSGISSLIKMLCSSEFFEMARFVIKVTGKNVSHYNIIIRERCRKHVVGEVHGLLEEMRELGCEPNINTYNYLLSNLCTTGRMPEACNMVRLMEESGISPNALTFDILIQDYCKHGNSDIAHQFFDQLVYRDIDPRIQTHVAFIRSYFSAGNYEEAHKYVRNLDNQHRKSINMIYSLVADLHLRKGHLIVARNIFIEMMEKGLKPNFLVFIKVVKRLQRSARGSLARDLRNRFSRFTM